MWPYSLVARAWLDPHSPNFLTEEMVVGMWGFSVWEGWL